MMKSRFGVALLLISTVAVGAPALAANPPERITSLIVYGDDACPKGDGDDIVVCSRKPESERYRIPKPLREKPAVSGGPGWGAQVANIEDVSRQTLPGSCNPIGSYGATGCTAAMLKQWFAEKRMQESAGVP